MSDMSAGRSTSPGRYEIRLKGHLGTRWATWFDGMTLTTGATAPPSSRAPSSTRPRCTACCSKVRDIGLPLLSVTRGRARPVDVPTTEPHLTAPRRPT